MWVFVEGGPSGELKVNLGGCGRCTQSHIPLEEEKNLEDAISKITWPEVERTVWSRPLRLGKWMALEDINLK